MEKDLNKLFTTTQNFALLREKLGEYKNVPSEKEMRDFIDFMDDIYEVSKSNLPPRVKSTLAKAEARRQFIDQVGKII